MLKPTSISQTMRYYETLCQRGRWDFFRRTIRSTNARLSVGFDSTVNSLGTIHPFCQSEESQERHSADDLRVYVAW